MAIKFIELYEDLKNGFTGNEGSEKLNSILKDIYNENQNLLKKVDKNNLVSKIPEKKYFVFVHEGKRSRAVNEKLYNVKDSEIFSFLDSLNNSAWKKYAADAITKICYKIAISFCCSVDLVKKDDQKTPGTYFEYFMGQLFTIVFAVIPRDKVDVLNVEGLDTKLPTDFIFDLGKGKPKFHVPVKTSTRERVIQVWAHQRVLDGVYGNGRFIGILTCLSETKVDQKKLEVVEICLPDQWRIYQLFIAQMKRVYYLDIPDKYLELNNWFPPIHVKQFGEFFKEKDTLHI